MPATAAVPKLQLPFAKGATWWVNGPHSFDGFTGARNSIDFGPGGSGAATVRAAAGGTAHVGTCSGGKYVTIDHGEGWSTRYWHLGSAARIDGKRVSAGDVIGKTALVCGNPTRFSHVHFGLFKKGAAVSLNGKSIGGYTVHSGASQYSGYWIRIKGGARVHTTGADGYAHCCLTNNQTQSTPSGDPIGNFDKATSPAAGKVRVAGWAFDPNRKRAPVRVVAYVGGASGASGAKRYSLGPAAKKRADVAKRHKGVGSNHGFDAIFSTSKRGKQKVCVYAINIGKGKSKLLGCKTVTIKSTASLGSAPLAQINAERGIAWGDFNRDGYADLAVGIPGEDVSSKRDAGSVNVIPGGSGGLNRAAATGYHQNHRGDANSIPVGSAEPGDYFGAAVTTGDFNRDGYADLAVGSPGEDIGSQKEAGTAHVILGGSAGLDRSKAAGYHQSDGSANSINVGSAEPSDYYGAALAAADFNRDGYADLAVGIPGEDVSSQGDAGSVNAIPGSAGGLDRNNAAGYHQNHNGDANSIPVGNAEPGDYFGGGILGAAFQ